MSAVPEILERLHPGEGSHAPAPAAPRRRGIRGLGGGGAIAGGVLAVALLTGIVPRVAQRHRLTAAAAAVLPPFFSWSRTSFSAVEAEATTLAPSMEITLA